MLAVAMVSPFIFAIPGGSSVLFIRLGSLASVASRLFLAQKWPQQNYVVISILHLPKSDLFMNEMVSKRDRAYTAGWEPERRRDSQPIPTGWRDEILNKCWIFK